MVPLEALGSVRYRIKSTRRTKRLLVGRADGGAYRFTLRAALDIRLSSIEQVVGLPELMQKPDHLVVVRNEIGRKLQGDHTIDVRIGAANARSPFLRSIFGRIPGERDPHLLGLMPPAAAAERD